MKKINPRCHVDMKQIYISADGFVMNCCWLGNMPHYNDFLEFFKDELDKISIKEKSLDEILDSKILKKVEDSWASEFPLKPCLKFCGKPLPDKNQKKLGNNDVNPIKIKSNEEN